MGWLFGRKKDDVLDLTERYKKQQERIAKVKEESGTSSSPALGGFGIFGMQSSSTSVSTSSGSNSNGYLNVSESEEKRKRLAKRFMEMTDKIEDLSNQIYHLQQRIEVLEKKAGSGRF